MIATVVWGTGNVGRPAIRAVDAHPALKLTSVIVHDDAKDGRDAGLLADLGHELGVPAPTDIDAVLAATPSAAAAAPPPPRTSPPSPPPARGPSSPRRPAGSASTRRSPTSPARSARER